MKPSFYKVLLPFILGIVIVGCGLFSSGRRYIPSDLTPESITSALDGLVNADQTAHQWDSHAYLVRVTSVYSVIEGKFDLEHSYYTFVSDSKAQYIGISIDTSGQIEVNPPANTGGAFVPTRRYSLKENEIQEREAIQLAWEYLGNELATNCAPLERMTIEGVVILLDNSQIWAINYSGHGAKLGDVNIDSVTGEIVYENINENICPNLDS